MRFRKKPVVIEAIQWTGQNWGAVCAFVPVPEIARGEDNPCDEHMDIIVNVIGGEARAAIGDWIIKGVAGEFYPCRDDIFRATYEPVLDEE